MDGRVLVVGDIHGCVDELNVLLDAVNPSSDDTVVFLGDYIDRGPYSREVVDRVLRLRQEGPRCVFLKGNHEDMFLGFLGLGGRYGQAFVMNGGGATLRSYGLEGQEGPKVAHSLPPEHKQFYLDLKSHFAHGAYLCVHAGVHPLRSLAQQDEEDLLWIREEFIRNRHLLPYTVLFGHTPQREVLIDLPYKIGLDTGLVYSNKLSCLELRDGQLIQVRRRDKSVRRTLLGEALRSAGR
jgi:serine/threonine protein phosphatase 1